MQFLKYHDYHHCQCYMIGFDFTESWTNVRRWNGEWKIQWGQTTFWVPPRRVWMWGDKVETTALEVMVVTGFTPAVIEEFVREMDEKYGDL